MDQVSLDQIVSLCKRRGFVFPSSEIYGGFAAVYDYGPYGVELANAIKAQWWYHTVQLRDDVVGLDSSIFMHPKIWESSGHVKGFADPLAECKECHTRSRVDHLLEEIGVQADEKMTETEINQLFQDNASQIKCPKCGKKNFTDVRKFNLLVQSNLGNFTGDWTKEPTYLRGETCQGIYVNYKNVLDSARVRVPFGIAQTGKAFRNEITARQFIFRKREFEQMELQYFVHPSQAMDEYNKLKQYRWDFYLSLGIKAENLQWHKHENLVFYAKEAYDIEYRFPFGFKELEGIHARGDYDLTQHSKGSGKDLSYIDPITQERYIPHVVESSVGVDRAFLAVISDAYHEEMVGDEMRVVLKLHPKLSPVKVAILPLSKKEPLTDYAEKLAKELRQSYRVEYDETQSIGKRYRRQDEIGTPYCITIDFETDVDHKVTIRERDSMQQERVALDQVSTYLRSKLGF
ncbi:glycine--tRNA ligase [Candidatus Gracilibacteria bacterium]|nr:glycine--tRNA ligase [Candidatus Gracilibacteria bacterium]